MTQELEVYDPPMCCSTGLCGPDVDPALLRFASDVEWLKESGVKVRRFNLSQSPAAFVENGAVNAALIEKGDKALPLIVVSGKVVSAGRYPSRDELSRLLSLKAGAIPESEDSSSCCCGGKC